MLDMRAERLQLFDKLLVAALDVMKAMKLVGNYIMIGS